VRHAPRLANFIGKSVDQRANFERGSRSAESVVLACRVQTEERGNPVTHLTCHHATKRFNRLAHPRNTFANDSLDFRDSQAFPEPGRPDDVREKRSYGSQFIDVGRSVRRRSIVQRYGYAVVQPFPPEVRNERLLKRFSTNGAHHINPAGHS
jgi:hypothetical protein